MISLPENLKFVELIPNETTKSFTTNTMNLVLGLLLCCLRAARGHYLHRHRFQRDEIRERMEMRNLDGDQSPPPGGSIASMEGNQYETIHMGQRPLKANLPKSSFAPSTLPRPSPWVWDDEQDDHHSQLSSVDWRLLSNIYIVADGPPLQPPEPSIKASMEATAKATPEFPCINSNTSSSSDVVYMGEIGPNTSGTANPTIRNPRTRPSKPYYLTHTFEPSTLFSSSDEAQRGFAGVERHISEAEKASKICKEHQPSSLPPLQSLTTKFCITLYRIQLLHS